MKNILIIGEGGSGKTTLAKRLSELLSFPVLSIDRFKYDESWNRRSREDFMKKLFDEISDQKTPVIFEGIVAISTSDPENVSNYVMLEVLKTCGILCVLEEDMTVRVSRMVDRSIDRHCGTSNDSIKETSAGRARMLMNTIQNSPINRELINMFELVAKRDDNLVLRGNADYIYQRYKNITN